MVPNPTHQPHSGRAPSGMLLDTPTGHNASRWLASCKRRKPDKLIKIVE
jgi:hypothetical protein